jgi:AcrR family transcriptional regulator
MIVPVTFELPQAGGHEDAPLERADAARNRERILKVAADLVACRGIDDVSMQEIAREAHVGTGTVYRRFGDRAGLALALLQADEATFQDRLLRGAPPLGPGAPAVERLQAFGAGYLEHLEQHAPLIAAASPTRPDDRGPSAFYLTHLTVLLGEACPGLDAEHAARFLWAGLAPAEFLAARRLREWPLERLQRGWEQLVGTLAAQSAAALAEA